MSYTIIRPKDRNEWLEHRKSGIGSSEVATILGLNPWETPYQLWRRKVGLDEPKTETFAMKAGHYLEDAVAQFWHDDTGREIIKSSAGDWLIRNNERPYLQVSPDRTYWLAGEKKNASNKGVLECKTTQMKISSDDLPKHWFCQVQYQLGVAELKEGSLAWLCSGREFGYKDLSFVPDFYAWIVEEVEKFWRDNIQGKKEPEATSVQDILLKFNRHTDGKIVEVNDAIFSDYQKLKEVKKEMDKLDEIKTKKFAEVMNNLKVENALVVLEGENKNVVLSGRNIPTVKVSATNEINTYDVLKYETLVVTKAAVEKLEEVYA